jgi:hypothetical protein
LLSGGQGLYTPWSPHFNSKFLFWEARVLHVRHEQIIPWFLAVPILLVVSDMWIHQNFPALLGVIVLSVVLVLLMRRARKAYPGLFAKLDTQAAEKTLVLPHDQRAHKELQELLVLQSRLVLLASRVQEDHKEMLSLQLQLDPLVQRVLRELWDRPELRERPEIQALLTRLEQPV